MAVPARKGPGLWEAGARQLRHVADGALMHGRFCAYGLWVDHSVFQTLRRLAQGCVRFVGGPFRLPNPAQTCAGLCTVIYPRYVRGGTEWSPHTSYITLYGVLGGHSDFQTKVCADLRRDVVVYGLWGDTIQSHAASQYVPHAVPFITG